LQATALKAGRRIMRAPKAGRQRPHDQFVLTVGRHIRWTGDAVAKLGRPPTDALHPRCASFPTIVFPARRAKRCRRGSICG